MVKKMIEDDDIDEEIKQPPENSHQTRKKIMLLVLPLLIVIGISVGVYFAMNNSYDSLSGSYNIVQYSKDSPDNVTVFFDLPEIKTTVKGKDGPHELRMKINLELSSIEELKIIEAMVARLKDSVLSHTIELNFDEITGSAGLYWLKEELLYRLNLSAAPVKIKNLNFNVFELQK